MVAFNLSETTSLEFPHPTFLRRCSLRLACDLSDARDRCDFVLISAFLDLFSCLWVTVVCCPVFGEIPIASEVSVLCFCSGCTSGNDYKSVHIQF